ncbi:MAG: hypothetical protein K6E78_05475 [Treponema sp.]|nr:hypothetical protein [Treponema sp.]
MKSTKLSLFSAKSALLSLLVLFVFSSAFVGCKQADDEDDLNLAYRQLTADDAIANVKWADDYTPWNNYDSTYDCRITPSFIETASYGKQEGKIYIVKISETSGYIYYQIKDTSSFSYSNKEASSYLDKWYGLYYEKLEADKVTMCDALPSFEPSDPVTYKIADYHCADSLEDAVKNITVENGYFENTTPFDKVTE